MSDESVGKLHKDLLKVMTKLERDVGCVDASIIKVIDVLDEARADFPTYAYAVGLWIGRTGRPVNDGLSEAGVQQILASERELWFKKWFGGAP